MTPPISRLGGANVSVALHTTTVSATGDGGARTDRHVVTTYTLSGCPQTPTAKIVFGGGTTMVVDMTAVARAAMRTNGTIVVQWDVTGGGADVVFKMADSTTPPSGAPSS